MAGLLEDYLTKRAAAVAAEKTAVTLVGKINVAHRVLGDANNPKNHHPNWRSAKHPSLPGDERSYGSRLSDWPTPAELIAKIDEYRQALAVAKEAFQCLQPYEREGVLPPP